MHNILLIDFEPSEIWNFDRLLEEKTNEKWVTVKQVSNLNQGNKFQTIIRYLKYFWLPLKVVLKGKSIKKILAWQQFYGIIYAFYVRLLRKRNYADLYIMTFIYKKKSGVIGSVYEKFIKYSLESKCVREVFVFSDTEPSYYSKVLGFDINKFRAINLGVEDYYRKQMYEGENEKFYLSIGRSNRDYEYLIHSWKSSWGKLIIVTDMPIEDDYNHSNIEIIRGCYEQDYYDLLYKSYAVIIPLNDENISSGELVTIQAGMFGKPTIATYNKTLKNYIENGVNGYMCLKCDLSEYIEKLNDNLLYNHLCIASRKKYEQKYSLDSMAREIAEYMQ